MMKRICVECKYHREWIGINADSHICVHGSIGYDMVTGEPGHARCIDRRKEGPLPGEVRRMASNELMGTDFSRICGYEGWHWEQKDKEDETNTT